MNSDDKPRIPNYRDFGYASEEEYLRSHPLDNNGYPMHDEIGALDEEDEAALDRAWARVMAHKRPGGVGWDDKPQASSQPTEATDPSNDDSGASDN